MCGGGGRGGGAVTNEYEMELLPTNRRYRLGLIDQE